MESFVYGLVLNYEILFFVLWLRPYNLYQGKVRTTTDCSLQTCLQLPPYGLYRSQGR